MGPVEAISTYFGCEPDRDWVTERNDVSFVSFSFEIASLKYWILVNLNTGMFGISADPTMPFSRESLYEIQAPFDRIAIETEECYGDQPILVCRKGFPGAPDIKTLMIVKWSETRVSVWQSYRYQK